MKHPWRLNPILNRNEEKEKSSPMNLITYNDIDLPLFARQCRDKYDAKKMIMNNTLAYKVSYVIFKNKRYTIKEVYKWE